MWFSLLNKEYFLFVNIKPTQETEPLKSISKYFYLFLVPHWIFFLLMHMIIISPLFLRLFVPAVANRVFGTNSSFCVEWRTVGKVSFLVFKSFLPVLAMLLSWRGAGHWAVILCSFAQFPDIS